MSWDTADTALFVSIAPLGQLFTCVMLILVLPLHIYPCHYFIIVIILSFHFILSYIPLSWYYPPTIHPAVRHPGIRRLPPRRTGRQAPRRAKPKPRRTFIVTPLEGAENEHSSGTRIVEILLSTRRHFSVLVTRIKPKHQENVIWCRRRTISLDFPLKYSIRPQ